MHIHSKVMNYNDYTDLGREQKFGSEKQSYSWVCSAGPLLKMKICFYGCVQTCSAENI